ncbi:MAG: D-alanyl-D-alanine carboxypeptidase family protein [Devosia sp.]|nr:D-alanyl-D-alanine carboxypeptidase family protein [Devosiaceae bacterium]
MRFARRLLLIIGLSAALVSLDTTQPVQARSSHSSHHTAPKPAAARPSKPSTPAPPPPTIDNPELLVDMATGNVLYEDNAGAPWHPASLTKLMTAYVTFQAIEDGRVHLDTKVTMSPLAVSQAPSRSGLPAGDSLSLQDALYIMLVKSANDMAVAIAETVSGSTDAFVTEMNATAAKLGLSRTHYNNVNGLPDDGQVTTARDLAVLAIDLRRTFPQYDQIYRTPMVTLGKVNLKASNVLLNKLEGTTGMKTGFICASGLNIVATVQRGGRELLGVYLGGTSERERDQLIAKLILEGFANQHPDTGKNVVDIVDDQTAPPMDMKPLLCGKNAKSYVLARYKLYPYGLKGQPNYLTDKVVGQSYAAVDFGKPGAQPISAVPQDDATAEGDAAPGDAAPGDDPAATPADVSVAAPGAPVPNPRPSFRK